MANPPGATGDIMQQGTWIAGVYTAPNIPGAIEKIDPATGRGQVQLAARAMLDTFETAFFFMDANQLAWQHADVKETETALHWMMVNAARVALNSTRTAANRVKFLEEAASWPMGMSGGVRQLADYFAAGASGATKDWSWVDPETDPPARTDADMWPQGFDRATNVETAPGSDRLIGRGWLRDIP